MIHIQKATINDAKILSEVGFYSFKSAHGHSAPKKDIEEYMTKNFTENVFFNELSEEKNHFFLVKYKNLVLDFKICALQKHQFGQYPHCKYYR